MYMEEYREEREIKIEIATWLKGEGGYDTSLIDVKGNVANIWKAPMVDNIGFSPDADILAYRKRDNKFVGIEVKGHRYSKNKGWYTPKLWEGFGEAMLYLANPEITKAHTREKVRGGIFDKVYLCYPDRSVFTQDFLDVVELTPIGLIVWDGEWEIIREAQQNPLMSLEAKKIFLKHLDSFVESYGRGRAWRQR